MIWQILVQWLINIPCEGECDESICCMIEKYFIQV